MLILPTGMFFVMARAAGQRTEDSSVTGGFAAARITVFCPLSSVLCPLTPSLREAQRRGHPSRHLDYFALPAMTMIESAFP
jgi:hypothetical protein